MHEKSPAYHKLVRDRIPAIIEANGEVPHTRILEEAEYQAELRKKLSEEVTEYQRDQNLDELADILEVVFALAETHGSDHATLEQLREEKATKRGGFSKRIFLESVTPDK